ncbi:MAG TPA: extracellular solute-binding protein [Halanaerobiales bacterium]|nr:extracellular solute-binding protein [Halanaerobiales bacterium]
MKIKKLLPVLLVLTLLFAFSAVTMAETLTVNTYTSDPAPRKAMKRLVEIYEENNPDIDVQLNITAHEDFKKAIRVWLSSDNPPDVFSWFAGNRAKYFVDKDLVMPFTDVWQEENLDEKIPRAFKSISFFEDEAYFLPHSYYWWAIYYRESIFEKYDLEEPQTWEQLLEVGETLKENGITPFAIGTKFKWTAAGWFDYLNMRINGPEFHVDLMHGEVPFTDDRVAEVFKKWKYLIENDFFVEDAAAYSWQEGLQFMTQGDAAMYLMGQFINDAVSEDVQKDMNFFRFPIINKNVPIGEDLPTDGFMIPAKAPNPELAKDFIAFLASVEGQRVFAEDMGRMVPNSDVPDEVYDEPALKGKEMIENTDALAQFYDRDMDPAMAGDTMDLLMKFWQYPDQYESIMEEMEQVRQKVME